MKVIIGSLFVLALLENFCYTLEKFSFDGYRLVRLTPKNENHLNYIKSWEDDNQFDLWNSIKSVDIPVNVLLSPLAFIKYQKLFNVSNLPFEVVEANIQNKIIEQERSMVRSKSDKSIVGKYPRYNEVLSYIQNIVSSNSDIATSYSTGNTFENRDLRVLVLKTSTSQKSVWLDCGVHAREWVSVSSCIWFIDRLLKDYRNNDAVVVSLLNYYEFHILPIANPDGYEYSHNYYRFWRKNMAENYELLAPCVGRDINRNFNFQWMVAGSSDKPCAENFAGPTPDSEKETQGIRNAINAKLGSWDLYMSLHSFGQYWLIPWGYTQTLPTDFADLQSISKVGTQALSSVYGTNFEIGSPAKFFGPSSGGSLDWAKAVAGINYSIVLELRPGNTGTDSTYGFTLPEDRAPAVGEETYIGLKAVINEVKNKNKVKI